MSASSPAPASDLPSVSSDIPNASPGLYNEDLAPAKDRRWGVFSIFNVWTSDVHSLFGYYLAASLFLLCGGFVPFLIAIGVGSLVIFVIMNLVGYAGVKTGVPYPVLARSSFGVWGANLPGADPRRRRLLLVRRADRRRFRRRRRAAHPQRRDPAVPPDQPPVEPLDAGGGSEIGQRSTDGGKGDELRRAFEPRRQPLIGAPIAVEPGTGAHGQGTGHRCRERFPFDMEGAEKRRRQHDGRDHGHQRPDRAIEPAQNFRVGGSVGHGGLWPPLLAARD